MKTECEREMQLLI